MKRALALALVTVLAAVATGCASYKGAKVTEGTDLAVGFNIPVSEGLLQFQAVNYLSGFRLGVDRNARLTVTYTVDETHDWLGVIHSKTKKEVTSTVEPCAEESASGDVPAAGGADLQPGTGDSPSAAVST